MRCNKKKGCAITPQKNLQNSKINWDIVRNHEILKPNHVWIEGGIVLVTTEAKRTNKDTQKCINENSQDNIPIFMFQVWMGSSLSGLTPSPSRFLRALAGFLPLFMTIAWIFSVALIVKGIVGDKESRLKETVRIMGLRGEVYWSTWLLTCLLPMAISSVLLTIIIKVI